MKNIFLIATLVLLGACGSQPTINACAAPNNLHGIYQDTSGAQNGVLTLESCDFKYRFGNLCTIMGTYTIDNDTAGRMTLANISYVGTCAGPTPTKSACTFSRDEPFLDLDCVELDFAAELRRQGN